MIQLDYAYAGIPLEVESDGEPVVADSLPTAVLYRNGSASDSITVTIASTAVTGLYLASFTSLGTGDGWAKTDRLFIRASAVIGGTTYEAIIWNSFSEPDAVMRGTDSAYTGTPPTAVAISNQVTTDLADDFAAISGLVLAPSPSIERAYGDTDAIRFTWPVDGATITGEVSKAGGSYTAVAGAISQRPDEGGKFWYQLAYNIADRQTGSQRYKLTDGTYTRYINLFVNPAGVTIDAQNVKAV